MGYLKSLKETSMAVHVTMVLFGMRAWVDLAGVWVEMPILVERLPEGWALASYVSAILQAANIFLLIYTVCHCLSPRLFTETRTISLIYLLGGVVCVLLIFFWERTSVVAGSDHSTALLALSFIMGGLDGTTSVVFVTFVSSFKQPYVTSMFIGQGFSQMLPSIVAMVQGVGNIQCENVSSLRHYNTNDIVYNSTEFTVQPKLLPPLFDTKYFFVIILVLEIISGVSFLCLLYLPICQHEKKPEKKDIAEQKTFSSVQEQNSVNGTKDTVEIKYSVDPKAETLPTLSTITRCQFSVLLMMAFSLNCLWNGILRGLQSYAVLPYGSQTYHLAVTLAEAANPLACILALFTPVPAISTLCFLSVVPTGVGAWVLVTAVLSPFPPLVGRTIGKVLAVISQIVVPGFVAYVKVCVAGILHRESRRAVMWFGIVVQIGSLVGAVIVFLCVNTFNRFESAGLCSSVQTIATQ